MTMRRNLVAGIKPKRSGGDGDHWTGITEPARRTIQLTENALARPSELSSDGYWVTGGSYHPGYVAQINQLYDSEELRAAIFNETTHEWSWSEPPPVPPSMGTLRFGNQGVSLPNNKVAFQTDGVGLAVLDLVSGTWTSSPGPSGPPLSGVASVLSVDAESAILGNLDTASSKMWFLDLNTLEFSDYNSDYIGYTQYLTLSRPTVGEHQIVTGRYVSVAGEDREIRVVNITKNSREIHFAEPLDEGYRKYNGGNWIPIDEGYAEILNPDESGTEIANQVRLLDKNTGALIAEDIFSVIAPRPTVDGFERFFVNTTGYDLALLFLKDGWDPAGATLDDIATNTRTAVYSEGKWYRDPTYYLDLIGMYSALYGQPIRQNYIYARNKERSTFSGAYFVGGLAGPNDTLTKNHRAEIFVPPIAR